MKNRYQNRWGSIRQIKIPNSIFQNGSLIFNGDSLAVYFSLLYLNKNKPSKDSDAYASVKVGQEKLVELTGYTKNAVTRAVKGLYTAQFIEPVEHRKRRGEFGAREYILCRPTDGKPLPPGRQPILGDRLSYFTFPECVVRERTAHWCLARLSASELKLYVAALLLAHRAKSNEFHATAADLRKLSGLSSPTFKRALDAVEERGLVWITGVGKTYSLHVCDPYTGQPLHEPDGNDENDPANYYVQGDKGQAKRLNLNMGDAGQIEQLVRSCLPSDETPIVLSNGDLMIRCPFHVDYNPSCSVAPGKNGCFYCFGCHTKGSLITLMMELRAIAKGEAIQQISEAFGAKTKYQEPDRNAIAIYPYRNEQDKLLKQVLRYPNVDGQKVFKQRRPGKGGWIWDAQQLPPMLFNMEWLKYAQVVCITEGEKDAQTVTELGLGGQYAVIGMTSGAANSWDSQLAKHLHGKRVVVMPDADAAGTKFAEEVKASLSAEGINFREVTFGDVGAKDVTEFLAEHKVEELVRRIGTDWVRMPKGQEIEDTFATTNVTFPAEAQLGDEIIY